MNRRAFVSGVTALALARRAAHARGRTAVGGHVSLRVPWPIAAIDPHRIDNPGAALFGEALFDTLYTQTPEGQIAPGLAEADPEPEGPNLRVRLRAGLRTAKDRPFTTKDAAWSIARARSGGARGWLADIPVPRDDGRALVFATKDTARLVHALASPIVAMVPTSFDPSAPDGTGPFRCSPSGDAMVFTRSRLAARGPAFLEGVTVRAAANISASMLAFEAGTDDIGWFERGKHEPRAKSERFDLGAVGWAVLFTGREANDWDGVGIAQSICDGIPHASIKDLYVGTAWPVSARQMWGGPPVALIVREDAPWLIEVANRIATTISQPSHEVTVRPIPAAELASRRTSRMYGLALDAVRNVVPGGLGALVALATADNPVRAQELMLHPPKLGDVAPRTLTRTLRCGVVGEIVVVGGRIPDLYLAPTNASNGSGGGFDLGASSRSHT
jgi:peptide/nickel transport system substrate-binding protein